MDVYKIIFQNTLQVPWAIPEFLLYCNPIKTKVNLFLSINVVNVDGGSFEDVPKNE